VDDDTATVSQEIYDLFISYSHRDEHLVKPLVQLLSLNQRRVFWDVENIAPGQEWAQEIKPSLTRSKLLSPV